MELRTPVNIHWELTNVCNLRCVHCYQQDDGPRHGLPAGETLTAIADRVIEAGAFELTLTGGEVLLVPQLPALVRSFNDRGIRPHITSNGMLVDDAAADWIAAAAVTFQVSIDGADPRRHNAIRQSRHAHERALAGVDRLVARGVDVSFAFTATPGNLDELGGIVALAAEHGVRRVCVGEVLPMFGSRDVRDRLGLEPSRFARFVAGLDELQHRYRGTVDVAVALLSGHVFDQRLRDAPCTALTRDLAILHDGWAYPCPFVRDPRQRLGNVLNQSIADIWSGPSARRFRREKTTRAVKHCVDSADRTGPVPLTLTRRANAPNPTTPIMEEPWQT